MNIAERDTPFTYFEIIEYFDKYPLVEITFIKISDEELRSFVCTRNYSIIEAHYRTRHMSFNSRYIITSENNIPVYVPSLNDWRSFTIKNLIEINGVEHLEGFKV